MNFAEGNLAGGHGAPGLQGVSRREVLKTLAAALPATALLAQNGKKQAPARRGIIDVHQHMISPAAPNAGQNSGWTPAKAIEDMEKSGLATGIVSPWNQAREILWAGTEKARGAVRETNDFGAKLVRDYPGRFGLYASLPFPDREGSLKEIEYAFDTLKADAVSLWSDTGDKWPGNAMFAPIFDELNRRKAVVFIHANTPNCCHNLDPGVPDSMNELDFDITRAVTSLLVNGTLSRCPDIKFIVAHSGATVPMLAGRIKDRVPKEAASKVPNGTYYELRKLHYEIAHAGFPFPMAALLKLAPMSNIMFGSDYPVERFETTLDELPASNLTPEDLRAIHRENAERLFPRLKS